MIKILEDKQPLYIRLLDEQDYTYKSVFDYIIKRITDYREYPGISLAYDEEYRSGTQSEVEDTVKIFIEDTVAPLIEKLGSNYEYDYTDAIDDAIKEDEYGEISRLEMEFQDLVEKKNKEWQDEMDELERYYWSTR